MLPFIKNKPRKTSSAFTSTTFSFLVLLVLCFFAQQGQAQLNEAITFNDITKAKAYAEKENVAILMVFAGSDWCRPCMQFKKSILLNDAFSAYSDTTLALLYLDFPLKKANKLSPEQTTHNEKLAEVYNTSGAFPAILLLDRNEKVLGKLPFKNQSPAEFIAQCEALLK